MLSTSTHVFSEIFLHTNWHCWKDGNYLTDGVETSVHAHIRNYCQKTKGIRFLGVGGTADHVHLVVQAEPTVGLADWTGKVKGAVSHEANRRFGEGTLRWQRGYGIVSFAKRDLDAVLRYVARQKGHHAEGTANPTLEQSGAGNGDGGEGAEDQQDG